MPEKMSLSGKNPTIAAILNGRLKPVNRQPVLDAETEKEIEKVLAAEELFLSRRLVAGAKIVCTGADAVENEVQLFNGQKVNYALSDINRPYISMYALYGGIVTQGSLELSHKDIEFEPVFKKCRACDSGICTPVIEDNEWKGYDTGYKVGEGFGLNKEEAYMICLNGNGGYIYPADDGQRNCMREFKIFLLENPEEKEVFKFKKILPAYACACTGVGEKADILSREQQEANAQYIYDFLTDKGWSKEAICGVLGNMQKESSMNPGVWEVWEDDKYGYGLVQWTGAEDKFLKYADLEVAEVNEKAETNGKELMDQQLEYLYISLQKGDYNEWLTSNTTKYYEKCPLSEGIPGDITAEEYSSSTYSVRDMTLIFHACYERSGDEKEQLEERVGYAEEWYDFFSR